MAHTILPGVVVAFLLGWPLAIGALVMGVLTALGIGALTERTALKEDTAIGVIFAGFFALGVALLSARGDYSIDLAHFCLLYTSLRIHTEITDLKPGLVSKRFPVNIRIIRHHP